MDELSKNFIKERKYKKESELKNTGNQMKNMLEASTIDLRMQKNSSVIWKTA